jgi:hypothetical protein
MIETISNLPQKNTVYTFNEVVLFDLPDSPFLQFIHNDIDCIIQTSHVTNKCLLSIPCMGESLWCYEKTTIEGIPLFWYFDDNIDILTLVDIRETGNESYWITPKGYPRADK